jgi:hypothetical protein
MAIQEEIENINDIICNIKLLMEDYFYTQNYINAHFATLDHTHPIDTETDITSNNPVTNKAITTALAGKADNTLADSSHDGLMSEGNFRKLESIQEEATKNVIDSNITSNSNNAVRSSAIYTALNNKADNVTADNSRNGLLTKEDYTKLSGIEPQATKNIVDSSLNASSTNAVQNKVINNALNNKADKNVTADNSRNGLMTTNHVNTITNLQLAVTELQNKVDKNDIRILFLRYHNGTFDGADGTQLIVNRNYDYVYAQIDCDDPSYNKANRTIRLYLNGTTYEYTTDKNGRTTTGKLIELPSGSYFISAFLKGDDNKNMVVDHKLLLVD